MAALSETAGKIETAHRSGAIDDLKVLVHRLKGTAANYGFPELTEAAGGCEVILRSGRGDLDAAVVKLVALLGATIDEHA